MSEAFFFFLSAVSSPSKSAKSLEEALVPLQPSVLWCVVWEKLLSGKVSQKISLWAPSSPVLRYRYVPRILNISLVKLWQAGACGSSNDLCLLPFTSWHVLPSHSSPDAPTSTVPLLWTPLQGSVQLTAASLLVLWAVLWELHLSMAETACPCRPLRWLDHNKADRRDTRDKRIYFHWVLEEIFIIQKYSFLIWFWERHQTPCPRFYWLKDFKTVKSQI